MIAQVPYLMLREVFSIQAITAPLLSDRKVLIVSDVLFGLRRHPHRDAGRPFIFVQNADLEKLEFGSDVIDIEEQNDKVQGVGSTYHRV